MVVSKWWGGSTGRDLNGGVLNVVFLSHSNVPSLQSLCIFSLANTEAGQAVINIMGIGVDTIDMVMASQSSR